MCHAFPQLQSLNVTCDLLIEMTFVRMESRRKFTYEKKAKVTLATTKLVFWISVGD